jgi:DNA-binding response OmpR family regulator
LLETSKAGPFEYFEAANGVESLMEVERHGPMDLILLDIAMPDLDGFAVCESIRRVDKGVPIVFVTIHADLEHRVKARDAGGDSFLAKPVRQGPLLSLVEVLTTAERSPTGTNPNR